MKTEDIIQIKKLLSSIEKDLKELEITDNTSIYDIEACIKILQKRLAITNEIIFDILKKCYMEHFNE